MEEGGECMVRFCGEANSSRFGTFDIADSILGGPNVSWIRVEGMLSKDGRDCR